MTEWSNNAPAALHQLAPHVYATCTFPKSAHPATARMCMPNLLPSTEAQGFQNLFSSLTRSPISGHCTYDRASFALSAALSTPPLASLAASLTLPCSTVIWS